MKYRLRTLFLVTTVCALALGVLTWHPPVQVAILCLCAISFWFGVALSMAGCILQGSHANLFRDVVSGTLASLGFVIAAISTFVAAVIVILLVAIAAASVLGVGQAAHDGTESTLCLWHDDMGRHAEYLRNRPPWADTEITDRGLSHLSQLTDLDELLIHGSRITDEGLEHLRGLTELKRLWLVRTGVIQAGAQRLRAGLPNCEITVMERKGDE